MTRFDAISKLTSAATVVAVVGAAIARTWWHGAFAVALAVLGVRMVVMAWGAGRRALPWSRLLLPGILVLEGAGLAWRGSAVLWNVRLGTAVVLELAFVAVAIRELRRPTSGTEPVEARIATAFGALLPPRAARLIAFEVVIMGAALRFASGGWRRGVPAGFTYHRASALRSFLPVLPLLAIGDVVLLELVILPHAPAWLRLVMHGAAIYGLLWLVGAYASLRGRPHELADGRLTLHRGMLKRLAVPVDQIASIDPLPSFADDWKKRAYVKGAIRIDVAGPPILELRLRGAARPIGVLGDGATGTRVLVAVDDPAAFIAAVRRVD